MSDDTTPVNGSGEIRRRSVMGELSGKITLPSGREPRAPHEFFEPSPTVAIDPVAAIADSHETQASVTPGVHAAPVVSGGGSRRTLWIAAAAVAGVVAIGAVAFAMTRPEQNPGVAGSVTPTITADVPEPVVIDVGYFDDGIAEGEYPPPVASRGDQYPPAHHMQEWVWDRVDSRWSLAMVSLPDLYYVDNPADYPVVFYLVSPEGAYFELTDVPSANLPTPALGSWREDDGIAMVGWDYGATAGEVDLSTGAIDQLEFRMSSGTSSRVEFRGATAGGTELMSAWLDGEQRYFTWSPSGGYQRILAAQTDIFSLWGGGSPTGEYAAFGIYSLADSGYASARSAPYGVFNAVVYTVETGASSVVRFAPPAGYTGCEFSYWWAPSKFLIGCYTPDWEWIQYEVDMAVSTTPHVAPASPGGDGSVYDQTATHIGDSIELVVGRDTNVVTGIKVTTNAGELIELTTDGYFQSATELSPGVWVVDLYYQLVKIDLNVGYVNPGMWVGTESADQLTRVQFVGYGAASLANQYGYGD